MSSSYINGDFFPFYLSVLSFSFLFFMAVIFFSDKKFAAKVSLPSHGWFRTILFRPIPLYGFQGPRTPLSLSVNKSCRSGSRSSSRTRIRGLFCCRSGFGCFRWIRMFFSGSWSGCFSRILFFLKKRISFVPKGLDQDPGFPEVGTGTGRVRIVFLSISFEIQTQKNTTIVKK